MDIGEENGGYSAHGDDDFWLNLVEEIREMVAGADDGFVGFGVAIVGLGAEDGVSDVDVRAEETGDREVAVVELHAGLTHQSYILTVFIFGWGLCHKKNSTGDGTRRWYRLAVGDTGAA